MLARLLIIGIVSAPMVFAHEDPFARLSIAEGQLPQACGLASQPAGGLAAERVSVRGWAALPIDSNPWRGTDRAAAAEIRSRLDTTMVPDGPPLDRRDLAAFRRNAADGVAQAYAAIYETADRRQVTVYAVQFDSAHGFEAAVARTKRRQTYRDPAARMLAVVSGQGDACMTRIESHLRGVFGR